MSVSLVWGDLPGPQFGCSARLYLRLDLKWMVLVPFLLSPGAITGWQRILGRSLPEVDANKIFEIEARSHVFQISRSQDRPKIQSSCLIENSYRWMLRNAR